MKIMCLSMFVIAATLVGCASTQGVRVESCKATTEQEIASLFDRWNQSLQTGDPHKVVANYAERSILLPTVSNKPRLTPAEKEDYFHHFLEDRPSGKIDLRTVELGCNTAVDAGLYTFTFAKTGAKVSGRYTYTYRSNSDAISVSVVALQLSMRAPCTTPDASCPGDVASFPPWAPETIGITIQAANMKGKIKMVRMTTSKH